MADCIVDRTQLFGLSITVPPDHAAVALIRRLPRVLWVGPLADDHTYRVALDARILPTLRRIYRLPGMTFTPAAIAALQDLAPSGGQEQPRVAVTPQVSPNARKLDATLDPTSGEGIGRGPLVKMTVPSSDRTRKDAAGGDKRTQKKTPLGSCAPRQQHIR